jgi:hypothetical protein
MMLTTNGPHILELPCPTHRVCKKHLKAGNIALWNHVLSSVRLCQKDLLDTCSKNLLTVQLLIQKRTAGIFFVNDTKGCYARIISGIALACLKRIRYSHKFVTMLGLLWSKLEHHVCTGYGASDATYRSSLDKLLNGIGQGSCAPPFLWAPLNQLLFAALGDTFDCIIFVAVDSVEEHIRPGKSLVDDTTCGATNDEPGIELTGVEVQQLTESEEKLVTRMQDNAQFFLDILQVTGGDPVTWHRTKVHGSSFFIDEKMAKQDFSNRTNNTDAYHFCHISRGKHQRQDT